MKNAYIERLAEADEFEIVKTVGEYYVDAVACSSTAFTLNVFDMNQYDTNDMQRILDGLSSTLLALKRKPAIRFQKSSQIAARVANEIAGVMGDAHRQAFDFRRMDVQPVLLIVDRLSDLTSVLLTQWTFQAMLHDMLPHGGIVNNRIRFDPDDAKQEMSLSIDQDAFYRENLYANYGQIGDRIQHMVRQYEQRAREHSRTDPASIVDMKRFIHDYPEWRRQGEQVAKYVSLACSLQRLIDDHRLLERSEMEQAMLTNGDPILALNVLESMMTEHGGEERLRMALLYVSYYGKRQGFNQLTLMDRMKPFISQEQVKMLDKVIQNMATYEQTQDTSSPIQQIGDNVLDDTVYTRHISPLTVTIDRLLRGRLPLHDFPIIQTSANQNSSQSDKPTDVIVFSVNGGSYQEECQLQRLVHRLHPHVRLVYGCTGFLNSGHVVEALAHME